VDYKTVYLVNQLLTAQIDDDGWPPPYREVAFVDI